MVKLFKNHLQNQRANVSIKNLTCSVGTMMSLIVICSNYSPSLSCPIKRQNEILHLLVLYFLNLSGVRNERYIHVPLLVYILMMIFLFVFLLENFRVIRAKEIQKPFSLHKEFSGFRTNNLRQSTTTWLRDKDQYLR